MNLNFLQRKTYRIWREKGDSGAENGMMTEYRKNNLEKKISKVIISKNKISRK